MNVDEKLWFVHQAGRDPVGPVSADMICRGFREGKIPSDSTVARDGDSGWIGVGELVKRVESESASMKSPSQPTPREARPRTVDPFEVESKSYSDALTQASGLSSLGGVIKVMGLLVIGASVLGGLAVSGNWSSMGIGIGIGGTTLGGVLLGMGSIIAAMGQVLAAVVRTAVNTKVSANVALGVTYEGDV